MEEPYVVASLPNPLDSRDGRLFAAPVHGLSASRKRKRHEAVVGIDGEGVNIYNVQTQSTVGSYALPPQTYLTTNPCSVFCKGGQSVTAQRQTILAVSESRKRRSPRLLSFTEESRKSASTVQSFLAPVKRERVLRDDRVLGLDIVPVRGDERHPGLKTAAIVSYLNGDVDCFSMNGLEVMWEYTAAERGDANVQVLYSTTVDLETASKGILRNREDVLQELGPNIAEMGGIGAPWLLFQVLAVENSTRIRVSSIRVEAQGSVRAGLSGLRELFTSHIPQSPPSEGQFELHAGSGLLYQMSGGHVKIFDLSSILPSLTFDSARQTTSTTDAFIRLTNSSVLVISHSQATIYESKYGSVVSSSSMPAWLSAGNKDRENDGKARKQKKRYLVCVSSLSDLGLVIVLAGNDLMALPIGQAVREAKRGRSRGPLLLDVIGKKRRATAGDLSQPASKTQITHDHWEDEVDRLIQANDVESLERLLVRSPDRPITDIGRANGEGTSTLPADDPSPHDSDWRKGGLSKDSRYVHSAKAMYILGKVFQWKSQDAESSRDGAQVEIAIKSWKIVESLALSGLLTSGYVELALSTSGPPPGQGLRIAPGAIMDALGQLGPDLSFVKQAFALPIFWDVSEVIQGVRSFMRVMAPHVEQNPALSNMVSSDNNLVPTDSGEGLAYRNSDLDVWLVALRPVFARLQVFPQELVTKTMRAMMDSGEILFLIGTLRLLLAGAGWTSRYVDATTDTCPDDLPIFNIVKLLSGAVDAIGAVGWIVGGSSTPEITANLIACLRAEVSAALESCYEAATLSTLLTELRRCEGSGVEKRSHDGRFKIDPDVASRPKILPLGSSIGWPVVEDRSLWEGKARRRPQNGARKGFVGNYAFERIRL